MSEKTQKYVPPHRRRRRNDNQQKGTPSSHTTTPSSFLENTIHSAWCINLESRRDKWEAFQKRCLAVSPGFHQKIRRFNAVNGKVEAEYSSTHDIQEEWDATLDTKYGGNKTLLSSGQKRIMNAGEIGCALSHIALWRKLVATTRGDPQAWLILEDDCAFINYQGKDRFAVAFERAWRALPSDWAILYLGFSARGERKYVDGSTAANSSEGRNPMDPQIRLYRPEYGYHTHAYMITKAGAQSLLENVPVSGPLDVWLADNDWFGLPVYCAVIAGEGWRLEDGTYEGRNLVHQVRGKNFKSDVQAPR